MFKQIKARALHQGREGIVRLMGRKKGATVSLPPDVIAQSILTERVLVFVDEKNCQIMLAAPDKLHLDNDGSYKIQSKKKGFSANECRRINFYNTGFIPDNYRETCEWEIHKNGSILVSYPDPVAAAFKDMEKRSSDQVEDRSQLPFGRL